MSEITREHIEYLKNFFVSKDVCDEKKHASDEQIQLLKLTMAKIGTKLSIMIGILGTIGVTILTVVAKFLFGG